jgi:hypothetical protein
MKHARLTFSAVGLLALLGATPAFAQTQAAAGDMGSTGNSMTGFRLGGGKQVDEATVEKRREIEDAYKKATRDQPAQATAVNDPWANMRGANEQKPAGKPAARTAAKTPQKKKPVQ